MERNLAGLQLNINRIAILLGVFNGLVEDVVLGWMTGVIGEVAEMVGAAEETHAGVAAVGVVNG
jgi:hypothetical protein